MPIHWLLLAASMVAAWGQPTEPGENSMATSIPPRDGDIAIREELDDVRRADTIEAYDLFIARHPQHPLAEVAREERARLTGTRRAGRP